MTLTPEQFNKLATKEDLKNYATRDETNEKFDQVLTAVDAVMHKLDIIEHAFVSNQAAHDRFEQRISNIEQHLGINPYNFSAVKN
ncbi:MAG: hypothetical protein PHU73_01295 [Patescibacteria group bacterium]|nr:hypothetical protein [Patescibacteria group bacterium]